MPTKSKKSHSSAKKELTKKAPLETKTEETEATPPGSEESTKPSYTVEEVADELLPESNPEPEPPTEPEPEELLEPTTNNDPVQSFNQLESTNLEDSMQNPSQDFSQQNPATTNPEATGAQHDFHFSNPPKRKFPWLIIIGIIALIVAGLVIWKLISNSSEPEEAPTVTDILVETSTETTESEEEEPKELDRTDYKAQVLNGSGIAGAAGKLAKVLETAGFEDVDTSNADNYNTQGVIIQVKDGQSSLAALVESDLSKDYEGISVKDNLDDDSEFDVVITLGSQPGDEDVLGDSDEVDEVDKATDKAAADDEATDSATTE